MVYWDTKSLPVRAVGQSPRCPCDAFIEGDEEIDASLARYRGYIAMMFLFIIALSGTVFFLRRPEPAPLTIATATPRATPTAGIVVVQVCGAVANPGVYALPEGSRVQDALKIAGNLSSNADTSVLNLARKLNDGEQLCVPRIGEVTPGTPVSVQPVNPKASGFCISYKDANLHMGETTCVRGSVISTGQSGTTFFINFDNAGDSFYAVSFKHTWDNLRGKCVEISGKITLFRGRPEIIIDDLAQLSFCK